MTTPLLYVAGPYSANETHTEEDHIRMAEEVSIQLIRNHFHVICPHKNTSGYEKYEDDNINFDTWIAMDLNILKRCDGLYLIDGWEKSKGSITEAKYAYNNKMLMFTEHFYPIDTFTLDIFFDVKLRHQKV